MVNDNGSEFITSVTVRMGDADSTSRAYPSRFFEWSHRAFEDLLMCAGDSLQAMFEEEDWGMPLVHAELHVVRGPSFDERLKIRLRLERLGSQSVTFQFQFSDARGQEVANTRLVHAFTRLSDIARTIDVPDRLVGVFGRMGLLGSGKTSSIGELKDTM